MGTRPAGMAGWLWERCCRPAGFAYDPGQPRDKAGRWTRAGAALRAHEERMRGITTHEELVVVDASGKELLHKKGDPGADRVEITPAESGIIRGGIMLHNHTRGSSFSPQDVKAACDHWAAEIRLVDAKYRYTFRRPAVILVFTPGSWGEIEKAYQRRRRVIARRLEDARRARLIDVDEQREREAHQVWERVSEDLGLIYERQEFAP